VDSSPSNTVETELGQLSQEYEDIFHEDLPDGLPPKRVVDHTIDTGDHCPANKNAYPFPIIQYYVDKLGRAVHLSSIDMILGYQQLRVAEQDILKTAFYMIFQYYCSSIIKSEDDKWKR
jgi:hypothetical protein